MDALSSQIYAIQLPPHLLAQPSAPAPFLPEDIHICGNCKQSFTDIRYFLQHKNECNAFLSSATAALLETSSVNLQMLPDQPLLQVVIDEDNNSVVIHPRSEDGGTELNSSDDTNETASALAVAATLIDCGNGSVSSTKRNIQIDEEDVASLLANQFAKEAVYIPPLSLTNDTSGSIIANEIFVEDKDVNSELDNVSNVDGTICLEKTLIDNVDSGLEDNQINDTIIDKCGDTNFNNSEKINDGIDVNCTKDLQNISLNQINEPVDGSPKLGVHEPQILLNKRLTNCNICSFVTMYPSDLTRHMRKHTGERPFECEVCSQRFPRKDKLQTHLRIHTGEKPYRCQFCDYAAIDSGPLRKHLRTHTDERPFKCQFCPYSAKDTSQLTVHLRTHTGDAPFICQFEKCGRAFKTSTDLKRHGSVHKRVHPFACKLCDYKATNKLNLQAHYQLSHNAVVSDNGFFKCIFIGCDFKITNLNDFLSHQKKLHPGPDIFNCDDSYEPYVTNYKKRKYTSRVNANSKTYVCNFCNHHARTKGSLKQHMRKHSNNTGGSNNWSGRVKNQIRPICHKAHQCTYCPVAFVRLDSLRSHLKQHQNNNSGSNTVPSSPPSKSLNKQQLDNAISSPDLTTNTSFFGDNIIDDEYIQI